MKHFVELHGGRVAMKSEVGEGTEVVCWLPVNASEQASVPDMLLTDGVAA